MPFFKHLLPWFAPMCTNEELQQSCLLWQVFDILFNCSRALYLLPYQMKLQGTFNINVIGKVLKEKKMFYVL
jgi:hypothetical protein